MRKKLLSKLDIPIHDINVQSFLNNNPIKYYRKLPMLNQEKINSYSRQLKANVQEKNKPLSESKSDSVAKKDIKKGIVWLKDEYFKIPKLIFSQKININTPLSERKIQWPKAYTNMKLNNKTFHISKDDTPIFHKFEKRRDLNEVLGLKKERSMFNILNYKKKEIDFDSYMKKLGVLKFFDERILKLVRVGKIQNISNNPNKNKTKEQIKKHNKNKGIISRYMLKKKLENKNHFRYSVNRSYDFILNKKKLRKKNIIWEESDNKINSMRNKRVSIVQKQIKEYDEIFRKITYKLKHFYEQKRKEFEQIIEDEFPIKVDDKT